MTFKLFKHFEGDQGDTYFGQDPQWLKGHGASESQPGNITASWSLTLSLDRSWMFPRASRALSTSTFLFSSDGSPFRWFTTCIWSMLGANMFTCRRLGGRWGLISSHTGAQIKTPDSHTDSNLRLNIFCWWNGRREILKSNVTLPYCLFLSEQHFITQRFNYQFYETGWSVPVSYWTAVTRECLHTFIYLIKKKMTEIITNIIFS